MVQQYLSNKKNVEKSTIKKSEIIVVHVIFFPQLGQNAASEVISCPHVGQEPITFGFGLGFTVNTSNTETVPETTTITSTNIKKSIPIEETYAVTVYETTLDQAAFPALS